MAIAIILQWKTVGKDVEKLDLHIPLMGMWHSAAMVEKVWQFLKKLNRISILSSSKRKQVFKQKMYTDINNSTNCNTQKVNVHQLMTR
jgi:hypothetical protein